MSDGGVVNNEARSRFELPIQGGMAVAQYEVDGDVLHMTHTVVPQAAEGQGVGSRLVRGALEEARSRGLKVDPICPFVRAYIDRHAEYEDLVARER